MTVQERINENSKNPKIQPAVGFSKSMPTPFDTDNMLEVGDVLVIPNPLPQVYKQTFDFTNAQGDPATGEYIVINVQHAGKPDRAINFFPSSLTKNIWKSEKDPATGEVQAVGGGPLQPKGTAVDLFTSFRGKVGPNGETDTQMGMNALAGKNINIAGKEPISTQVWEKGQRTNRLRTSSLLTYNL